MMVILKLPILYLVGGVLVGDPGRAGAARGRDAGELIDAADPSRWSRGPAAGPSRAAARTQHARATDGEAARP